MAHVLHTIWVDKKEPTNVDTLWIRPMKNGSFGVYVYGIKGWNLITAEFKGTFGEFVVSQLPIATQEANGLMSKEDKQKLDALGIQYGTTEYWNSQPYYIPPAGTIIIYSDYDVKIEDGKATYIPGIKIGSGNAYVQDLVFISGGGLEELNDHINNHVIHIDQLERDFWNNKLNVTDHMEVVDETLIFNRH